MIKSISFLLSFFLFAPIINCQEIEYKEYSYTEFFALIASETDSIFTLENAAIIINDEVDGRFIRNSENLDTIEIN